MITSAVILIGGESRRMGQPKHSLVWNDRTLLERQLNVLQGMFNEVLISCNAEQGKSISDSSLVMDTLPDKGPLGGILSALQAVPKSEKGIFVSACDLVGYQREDVKRLLLSHQSDKEATIARSASANRQQPLLGIWSRKLLPRLVRAVEGSELGVLHFLRNCNVEHVDLPEHTLRNINTMRDFDDLRDAQSTPFSNHESQ